MDQEQKTVNFLNNDDVIFDLFFANHRIKIAL